jgi:hypothetical protein
MRSLLLGLTLAAVALDSAPVAAQRAGGAGWASYYGCWIPGDPSAAAVDSRRALVEGTLTDIAPPEAYAQGPMRCVLPGGANDRVQMLTVQRGRVVDRQEVIADGADHAVDRDGCTGRERATWTGGGARLVVKGDLSCKGGTVGTTSSMLDVVSPTSWVQVSGIRSGKNVEARPQWYRRVAPDSTWPAEVASALANTGTAAQIARVGAIADPDVREIAQLARVVDEAVLRAWLVSRSAAGRRNVPVTGETLVQLADAGVSGSVTDVMVALANPESFDLTDGGVRSAATTSTGYGGGSDGRMRRGGYSWMNDPGCYGPWSPYAWSGYSPMYGGYFPSSAFDGCNMYGYSPYGRGWSLGLAYGYPYGSPYLGYGGGWFWRPVGSITPVVRGPDTHTTLSKGGGYSPAGSGQGQGRTGGSSGSSGTTANSTGSSGAKPAPAPASSSGGRTAVKKP